MKGYLWVFFSARKRGKINAGSDNQPMTEALILEKLLLEKQSSLLREQGLQEFGGLVGDARILAKLTTPAQILAAFGFQKTRPFVDILRFSCLPNMELSSPPADVRPWPTFPEGRLQPVGELQSRAWYLSTTRVPFGAEVWRVWPNRQEKINTYEGAVDGWSESKAWMPPSIWCGLLATWNELTCWADLVPAGVLLSTLPSKVEAPTWTIPRHGLAWKLVPPEECEFFENFASFSIEGHDFRVLESSATSISGEIQGISPELAEHFGAHMVDLDVFRVAFPGDTGFSLARKSWKFQSTRG